MPTRDRRPLLIATAVAVGSLAALTAAVRYGWLGPDAGRGAGFCEAARAGLVKQPANTLSNVGFVVAGLVVANRAGDRATLGSVMGARPVLATSYAVLVVLLGPGSMAMHATQSAAGGLLDTTSMYLLASFAAAYGLMRWLRRGPAVLAVAFLAFLAGSELAGTLSEPVPVVDDAGNLAFGLLLLMAIGLEVAISRRGESRLDLRYAGAAAGTLAVAFGIWNLAKAGSPLCHPHSLVQGHAAWHLLCAVAAYFLFRLYASERPPIPPGASG